MIAADDQGIHNNVIHVEPAHDATEQPPIPDAAPTNPPAPISHEPLSKRLESRKDSTMDQDQLPDIAAHTTPKPEQASNVDSPVEPDTLQPPAVPLVVLDKVDDMPEQSSKDATAAQKVARDMRAADASPDKVNLVPDQHVEPPHVEPSADQEQASPLFRHESFQSEEPPSAPSMDTIDEESTLSSADQTSSGDAMDTPSELDDGDEGDEGDELNIMPLLSHETGLGQETRELANGPLFAHEAEPEAHPAHQTPLFSHETNLPDDTAVTTDSDGVDELDRFPLLAHESGFSDYKGSEIVTKSDYTQEEEPQHYGPYHDDGESDDHPAGPGDDAPLLPHEREAAVANNTGSDSGHEDSPFSLEKQTTFGYETDSAKNLFGGTARHDFFRPRTNSSLPHRLPRSDAEDDDLNDPSLERFPTNRDQILQRVATIGVNLPEDETRHGHPHSPQPSVFSQACSSVDLVPVKSYTSLASVPEADDSDEDEDEDRHDLDSIPSPVYIGRHMLRMSNSPSAFARDPHATPVTDASKRLDDAIQTKDHAREPSGEANDINGHDGAKDVPEPASALHDAISMPNETAAAPVKPSLNATSEETHSEPISDSQLRQRKGLAEEPAQKSDAPRTTDEGTTTTTTKEKIANTIPSSALAPQSEKRQEASPKASGISRLLTACVGDRKVAR